MLPLAKQTACIVSRNFWTGRQQTVREHDKTGAEKLVKERQETLQPVQSLLDAHSFYTNGNVSGG